MAEETNNYKPHRPKVINPLTPEGNADNGATPAVDMIRNKLSHLYEDMEKVQAPVKTEQSQPAQPQITSPKTKHQQYMFDLQNSGKSLAQIQTAWHEYYVNLSDKEKHEVWQEFYAEHQKPKTSSQNSDPKETRADGEDERRTEDVKKQILRKVSKNAKPKNPHLQSLIFGLGMGSVVVAMMLFGFFNERIIAPFITPSRTVSSTPIITDISQAAVGKDPKIIIPKINVEVPVVYDEPSVAEDDVQKALERGVLHYATTPNPGEKGNATIFGHSSNNILNSGKYKFAFVLLSRLENGDTFMLEKDGKRYVYKIFEKKVVPPTDLSVLNNHGDKSTVTLITCDPPGTSINRLVVVGEQISPSPSNNVASSVKNAQPANAEILPSNSPSLWQRITGGI